MKLNKMRAFSLSKNIAAHERRSTPFTPITWSIIVSLMVNIDLLSSAFTIYTAIRSNKLVFLLKYHLPLVDFNIFTPKLPNAIHKNGFIFQPLKACKVIVNMGRTERKIHIPATFPQRLPGGTHLKFKLKTLPMVQV